MREEMYLKLAKVLDTLPNGFPTTESGVEIKLLKRIFRPEDTELFCDLKLSFETAQQISERTGRPLDGLEDHLIEMWQRGQLFGADIGGIMVFKMVPWAFGIYEFQCIHTPGHTPGSISILIETEDQKKILFGQDVHGPIIPGVSDYNDYQNSLQKLLDLKADILCEGHFGIFQPASEVQRYINKYIE